MSPFTGAQSEDITTSCTGVVDSIEPNYFELLCGGHISESDALSGIGGRRQDSHLPCGRVTNEYNVLNGRSNAYQSSAGLDRDGTCGVFDFEQRLLLNCYRAFVNKSFFGAVVHG